MRRVWLWPLLLVVPILCVALVVGYKASASTFGSGTFGTCQFGSCSISLSTDGEVELNITPTSSGSCTINDDTVSVATDNSNGYTLTLTMSGADTNLKDGSNTIPASAATNASPTSLSNNTWGYRVDGLSSFGAGPTTSASNASPSAITFAGVPALNGTAVVLANTSEAANPAENTTVWYGVCANTALPSGSYSGDVTYTALTN